jgi:hypothetical protein
VRYHDLAKILLDCVCQCLEEKQGACPSRACVASGEEVAIENCCAGNDQGQLTVNIARIFPSASFPTPALGIPNNCDVPLEVVTYHVQLARCHPSGQGRTPPTCAQLEAAALRVHDDMLLMRAGIKKCMKTNGQMFALLGTKPRWTFGEHVAIGPQGGCVGSLMQILVGFPNCEDC